MLISLFVSSILASTLIPGGVEGLLVAMVYQQTYHWITLFLIATAGNTLGGVLTFGVGVWLQRAIRHGRPRPAFLRWFRLKNTALSRVRRYGYPALLFSWLPVVGDPLCLAAGVLGLRMGYSALMILVGKAARYGVLLWVVYKIV